LGMDRAARPLNRGRFANGMCLDGREAPARRGSNTADYERPLSAIESVSFILVHDVDLRKLAPSRNKEKKRTGEASLPTLSCKSSRSTMGRYGQCSMLGSRNGGNGANSRPIDAEEA
jgi:hypothetical protein